MTYEDMIARFEKRNATARGVMVKCPAHDDGSASLSIGRSRDGGVVLKCFAECRTEDIVAAMGLEMKDLFAKELPQRRFPPPRQDPPKEQERTPGERPVVEATYTYRDALGREVYQAVRLKPKSFRQRHSVDGRWVWTMDGVERVLYRLPEVAKSQKVWVVEGEKDADNVSALGFCGTCNVGGAGKWLDGYTAALAGKDVVLCGDNDAPGRKHMEAVFESIAGRARTVKVLALPESVKDVSDHIATFPDAEQAARALAQLEADAVPHVGGVRLPVYSMADIEPKYLAQVKASDALAVDLGEWLPSFRGRVRRLTPGTMVLVLGDTGIGKTNVLLNIAAAFHRLPTLFFELELTEEDLFERVWANKVKCRCSEVEDGYLADGMHGPAAMAKLFPNLFICPEEDLTVEKMEAIVVKSELKMGVKPRVVLADYAQLFKGKGERYERVSDAAEAFKRMVKATRTVGVLASQIDRGSGKEGRVGLHSGKDSGSLENSAGLVLGAVRDEKDRTLMKIKVLKATRGGTGLEIDCDYDGARATITERVKEDK